MRRHIYTYYLDWSRALAERSFVPADVSPTFPQVCTVLWNDGYYVRSGKSQYGLPMSSDAIVICNAVFDRFNADDRPDREWRRSFSVGDIVQIDRTYYLCRSLGWERLNLTSQEWLQD